MELAKSYDAKTVESVWYQQWEDAQLFKADAKAPLPYVLMMPPPNVTGSLHNGHALFVTLEDILIRLHRMRGKNTLWLPGIDHAGISTQTVVERELWRTEKKTRQEIGRKEFVRRVWDWKEKNGSRIIEQLKLMGASADWSRCKFTLDEPLSAAVREAFVRLWNEGLIYRGERLVNWDPKTQTALSDEEVDHEAREGELWRFAYAFKDGSGEIVVATTRPETMLGDVAVAVHPTDDRYRDAIGKELLHPFFADRVVKIIADEQVDPEFGTGAVKITPAHDPADFAMAERHGLLRINIMTLDARINANGGKYQGLSRFEARDRVKEDLMALGAHRGDEKIQHAVTISQRSGEDIEPMLSRQYFVHAKPLAKKAYDAVASGQTRIMPQQWQKTWDHFLLNIQDWCISRQLWWGHQIPVFYDMEQVRALMKDRAVSDADLLKAALNELDDQTIKNFSIASVENLADQNPSRFIQEEDVLDTWFSSGLWPFSTLGWPNETEDLKTFYPGTVLETGSDILFFWVARMMMMGIHFMGRPPFKDIYLHSMVRDSHGKKMSKSLGNAIDPIDVMNGIALQELLEKTKTYPVPEKLLPKVLEGLKKDYPEGIPGSGADGLRLSLAILSGHGRDVKLSIPRVSGYRAFLNKIWNATRFALMRIGDDPVQPLSELKNDLQLEDRWILTRLQETIQTVNTALDEYEFSKASEAIYHFFWSELCDWYVEFVKPRLGEENRSQAARSVLVELLETSMRLLHPFCPFISEEIWQKLQAVVPAKTGTQPAFCAVAPYPALDHTWIDLDAKKQMTIVQETIVAIRNARQESGLPAQKKVPVIIACENDNVFNLLTSFQPAIERLALTESLRFERRHQFQAPKAAVVNSLALADVILPLEGLIDFKAERERLEKEVQKVQKQGQSLRTRLSDSGFLARAPAEVISEAKESLENLTKQEERIQQSIARLPS